MATTHATHTEAKSEAKKAQPSAMEPVLASLGLLLEAARAADDGNAVGVLERINRDVLALPQDYFALEMTDEVKPVADAALATAKAAIASRQATAAQAQTYGGAIEMLPRLAATPVNGSPSLAQQGLTRLAEKLKADADKAKQAAADKTHANAKK